MKQLIKCCVLLAFAITSTSFANVIEDIKIEKGVHVLTKINFDSFVKSKSLVLVEFYSPGCTHCKKLEPEFSKAALKLKDSGIALAKVDATIEEDLAKEFMVQGYPTLIIFKDGKRFQDYQEDDRTSLGLVKHMMSLHDPTWVPPPSEVVSLTGDTFTNFVNSEMLSLVMFYAPWCGHCKKTFPELEAAAVELKSWGIPLAKLDGTKYQEIADKYNVGAWPTIKMFRLGRVYDFGGSREAAGIVSYMKEQAKPPSDLKTHRYGITNSFDGREITVVGFFEGRSDLFQEFLAAANTMRGAFRFLHTFSQQAANELEVPMESVTVFMPELFRSPYENKTYSLSKKSATSKEIIAFINSHSIPLLGQRTKRNAFKYTHRPLVVVYADINFESQHILDTKYISNKVLEVAKDYMNTNLKFALSDEAEFADEIKSLGFEDDNAEVMVGCLTGKQRFKMAPKKGFESQDLVNFIEDLKYGKVSPYSKSQPIPENNTAPVKIIVADNYDTEIHRVKKDAVLFVHAPWCGHCKEFSPIYKKLAKKIQKTNENIVFGMIDGTVNDIPFMYPNIKGYPALFFLPVNDKYNPIQHNGERTGKTVKNWIKNLTSVIVKGEDRSNPEEEEIESYTAENFLEEITKDNTEP